MSKLVNIAHLCKILNLVEPKTKKPLTHTIRYWEKEFSQIKPKKINNRRYYSSKDIELIKFIKSLIKDEKITIAGVKNILQKNAKELDEHYVDSLKIKNVKLNLKNKTKVLLEKISKLKKYGKKNTS